MNKTINDVMDESVEATRDKMPQIPENLDDNLPEGFKLRKDGMYDGPEKKKYVFLPGKEYEEITSENFQPFYTGRSDPHWDNGHPYHE